MAGITTAMSIGLQERVIDSGPPSDAKADATTTDNDDGGISCQFRSLSTPLSL
jgi:hypothetical protein